ncbi:MAG: oligosaccharide flippase family protein [Cyanobacteria bacterium J06581_3]
MSKKISSEFIGSLFSTYTSQVVSLLSSFLQVILINKNFGVDIYGQLVVVASTAGFFSSLLTARSSETVALFFKREQLEGNDESSKFILFLGLFVDLLTAIVLVLLIYALSNFIAAAFLQDSNLSDEINLYSYVTFFVFLRGPFLGYLKAKEMFLQINIVTMLESVIKVSLIAILIFYTTQLDLKRIVAAFLIASIAAFSVAAIFASTSYAEDYKRDSFVVEFNRELLKEYWNFNLKTFASSTLKAGSENIDNLVLGYFLNAESVGIYQTMRKLFFPLSFLTSPLPMLMLNKMITAYSNEQFKRLNRIISSTNKYLVVPIFLISIAVYLLAKPYLTYQNIKIVDDFNIIFSLMLSYFVLSAFQWWMRNFIVMHRPDIPIYTNALLSLNSIWIPILLFNLSYFSSKGLLTISLASVLAYFPSWLIGIIVYHRFVRLKGVL